MIRDSSDLQQKETEALRRDVGILKGVKTWSDGTTYKPEMVKI